jgi:hypothetical protein
MKSRKSRGIGIIIEIQLPEQFQRFESLAWRLRPPKIRISALRRKRLFDENRPVDPGLVEQRSRHGENDVAGLASDNRNLPESYAKRQ